MNASAFGYLSRDETLPYSGTSTVGTSFIGKNLVMEAIVSMPRLAEEFEYEKVGTTTLLTAVQFVNALPENRRLPRVTVDECGEIVLVWTAPAETVAIAVVLKNEVISAVAHPSSNASHIEDVVFGGYVPPSILEHVPRR